MLLFAIIEYRYIGYHVNNYITAKTITIFLILLIIGAVFYTYFYVAGKQIAAADISIFVGALIIGQMVGAWVMTFDPLPRYFNFIAIGLLVALAIVLIVLPTILSTFAFSSTAPPGLRLAVGRISKSSNRLRFVLICDNLSDISLYLTGRGDLILAANQTLQNAKLAQRRVLYPTARYRG